MDNSEYICTYKQRTDGWKEMVKIILSELSKN